MVNRKRGMRGISDKDLVALINKKLSAQEICQKAEISLPTLQRRVGEIMQKYKKFVNVPGLYAKRGNIRFSGMGIVIDSPFKAGDEFCIEVGDDCSINWTGNMITLTKIAPPIQEREIEKANDKIRPTQEDRAIEATAEKRPQKKGEDLESLDALFENL